MWKIEYEAPVGLRTNHGFWGITCLNMGSPWWCEELELELNLK